MSYLQELLKDAYKEGMTEDEISEALEKAVKAEPKSEGTDYKKLKSAFDRASAEASKYKKQLEEKMTADEREEAERKEALDKLIKENAEFKKKIAVTENKAQLISLGYPEDLAMSTAEAMFNGDTATVFKNQKAMFDAREKAIRADVLKETPVPKAGAGSTDITKAQFEAMSTFELMDLYQRDPELYEKLSSASE